MPGTPSASGAPIDLEGSSDFDGREKEPTVQESRSLSEALANVNDTGLQSELDILRRRRVQMSPAPSGSSLGDSPAYSLISSRPPRSRKPVQSLQ